MAQFRRARSGSEQFESSENELEELDGSLEKLDELEREFQTALQRIQNLKRGISEKIKAAQLAKIRDQLKDA